MNRTELSEALGQVGLPADLYALDGDWTALANDGYLLVAEGGGGVGIVYRVVSQFSIATDSRAVSLVERKQVGVRSG